MGRKPKSLPANDPSRFSRALKGARSDLHPDVRLTVLTWLHAVRMGYADQIARLRTRAPDVSPKHLAGLLRQLESVFEACGLLCWEVDRPVSRLRWLQAVADAESWTTEKADPHDPVQGQ